MFWDVNGILEITSTEGKPSQRSRKPLSLNRWKISGLSGKTDAPVELLV